MLRGVFYRLIRASDMSNSAIEVNATNDAFKKIDEKEILNWDSWKMMRQDMGGGAE